MQIAVFRDSVIKYQLVVPRSKVREKLAEIKKMFKQQTSFDTAINAIDIKVTKAIEIELGSPVRMFVKEKC